MARVHAWLQALLSLFDLVVPFQHIHNGAFLSIASDGSALRATGECGSGWVKVEADGGRGEAAGGRREAAGGRGDTACERGETGGR